MQPMKYVASIILLLLTVLFVVLLTVLIRNETHLLAAPGVIERIKVYFSQNIAYTAEQHAFPELRPGVFPVSTEVLYRAVQAAISKLGWSLATAEETMATEDAGEYLIHAVVTTALFQFKDDVVIRIQEQACAQAINSTLAVRSSSRLGKADFGANAAHIQRLFAQVELELGRPRLPAAQAASCDDDASLA